MIQQCLVRLNLLSIMWKPFFCQPHHQAKKIVLVKSRIHIQQDGTGSCTSRPDAGKQHHGHRYFHNDQSGGESTPRDLNASYASRLSTLPERLHLTPAAPEPGQR